MPLYEGSKYEQEHGYSIGQSAADVSSEEYVNKKTENIIGNVEGGSKREVVV